jgi:hypothetical protein
MRASLTFALLLACAAAALAQPTIISVVPNTVTPGQQLSLAMAGMNTHFIEQYTSLSLGDGIRVISVHVNRPDLLTATIEVDPSAASGPRTVRVSTAIRNEVAELPDALTIIAPGGDLRIAVTIVPVDRMRMSDFDPNNKANAALLFSATVYNNQVERKSSLQISITHEKYGLIITGTKPLDVLRPGEIRTVNNKEIDQYIVNPDAKPYLLDALLTGFLPAGTYTYHVTLRDEKGNAIVEDAGSSVLTNPGPGISLIGPGYIVGSKPSQEPPSVIPYFQWTSTLLSNFELTVFEVREGQTSPEDIQRNVPVYQAKNIGQTFLVYPNSARLLEKDRTYAWQVTAQATGDFRDPVVKSEMFWFAFDQSGEPRQEMFIHIDPKEADTVCGATMRFALRNHMGMPVPTKKDGKTGKWSDLGYVVAGSDEFQIDWSVLPQDAGTIDQNGAFTAGEHAAAIAVVATITALREDKPDGSALIEDYASVRISPRIDFEFLKRIMEMLGN